MSKRTYDERPMLVGRTSRWSLGIDDYIIAIIICVPIFLVFAAALVMALVAPGFMSDIMQNSPDLLLYIMIAAGSLLFLGLFTLTVVASLADSSAPTKKGTIAFLLVLLALLLAFVIALIALFGSAKEMFVNDTDKARVRLIAVSAVFVLYSLIFAICVYSRALVSVSRALDDGRSGVPNNARNLTSDRTAYRGDMPNHNGVRYVYFKLYKEKIVITDFTGWREWVYLVAGIYHIRVRQTWFGKAFNYGDVVIRSIGTAGQIVFPGIKDPHELKAILQKQIKTGTVNLAGIIPPAVNG